MMKDTCPGLDMDMSTLVILANSMSQVQGCSFKGLVATQLREKMKHCLALLHNKQEHGVNGIQ